MPELERLVFVSVRLLVDAKEVMRVRAFDRAVRIGRVEYEMALLMQRSDLDAAILFIAAHIRGQEVAAREAAPAHNF